MSAITLLEFRIAMAESLYDSIVAEESNYYYFVGKPVEWDEEDTDVEDPVGTTPYLNQVRQDMVFLKKIQESNCAFMVPKIEWETGTVYTAYDDSDDELPETNFYVVHSNKIYKCLKNNNGEESTVAPFGMSAQPLGSLDGYVWQFVCSVPNSHMDEFGTDTEIPLGEAGGSSTLGIYRVVVTAPGTGYTSATVTIEGDGAGCTAEAVIEAGAVVAIDVETYGDDYHFATVIIDGNGSGATARAVVAPTGGHGSNPVRELYSHALRLSVELSVAEADLNQEFVVDNEYRQTGIIKDPLAYGGVDKYTDYIGSPCFVITGDFEYTSVSNDEVLTDTSGSRYRVVSKPEEDPGEDPVSLLVQSLDNAEPAEDDIILYGITQAILSDVTLADVDKYSGMIVCVDNREPYQPDDDQLISFKTTIRF